MAKKNSASNNLKATFSEKQTKGGSTPLFQEKASLLLHKKLTELSEFQ